MTEIERKIEAVRADHIIPEADKQAILGMWERAKASGLPDDEAMAQIEANIYQQALYGGVLHKIAAPKGKLP